MFNSPWQKIAPPSPAPPPPPPRPPDPPPPPCVMPPLIVTLSNVRLPLLAMVNNRIAGAPFARLSAMPPPVAGPSIVTVLVITSADGPNVLFADDDSAIVPLTRN